ncbi:MAG: hypothetical protein WAM67_15180 [Candidatus Acidiferrales bacterium]
MAATQALAQGGSATQSSAKNPGGTRVNPVRRPATDDEILGIVPDPTDATANRHTGTKPDPDGPGRTSSLDVDAESRPTASSAEPENLRAAFYAHPELREAWQEAQEYRETFATPEEARAATGLLADLDQMDALFFSPRAEDHAALARAVADLDPAAFVSLARAMGELATETQRHGENPVGRKGSAPETVSDPPAGKALSNTKTAPTIGEPREGATAAQEEFFHSTNAAAVQSVLDAVESQVERLLPEGTSKSARNRVVGEIYRELDNTLRSNRQLSQQVREAFRSGSLDADHQRAIVSLISGRARQALPGVAKRVLSEWTSTVVSAHQDRRARQRAAERRVDIAGSNGGGNDGRRPTTPRDIDYARMSDADILNL